MEYTGQDTIYDYLSNIDIPDGIHSMKLANGEVIDFEIYNYYENTTFSETPVLGDNVPDTKMLILKFYKNLTIKEGIKIIPQVRKKGMTIYCAGILENNGTISMTARGAIAQGQDVLLYRNNDGTYEFVPKVGAAGGSSYSFRGNGTSNGYQGANATGRKTGGGASGGVNGASYSYGIAQVARGGNGTSYSGGSGSGGISMMYESSTTWRGEAASDIGGKGGNALGTNDERMFIGGGIGNPTGRGIRFNSNAEGTGGLLIIYSGYIFNNGIIEANGIGNNKGSILSSQPWGCTGGGSGGGSVNIFYTGLYKNNIITANGGYAGSIGSKGGNGTVTYQKISDKYYLIKSNNEYKYYLNNQWNTLTRIPNFDDFINYGMNNLTEIPNDLWMELDRNIEVIFATNLNVFASLFFKAIPKEQMILQTSYIELNLIKDVKSFISNDELLGNGLIRCILSTDMGQTWLYFENTWKEFKFINPPPTEKYPNILWNEWLDKEHAQDIENIKQIGITKEQLSVSGITQQQWSEIFPSENYRKKVLFITVISAEEYTDIAEAKNMQINQESYEEYISNTNYTQTQKTDRITIVPKFSSKQIKINFMM